MSYQHDVFLSYWTGYDWPKYIETHFLPKLNFHLTNDLGRIPQIFYAKPEMSPGDLWMPRLVNDLAHSKVMICLWSKGYFGSEWCSAELKSMLRRKESLTTPTHHPTLVVAVVVHDSEDLPPDLTQIQRFDLHKYASPWIASGSTMEMELDQKISSLSRAVARAIEHAPEFDPSWERPIDRQLKSAYAKHAGQRTLPRLG